MNRRFFTFSLAALAAAPALPMSGSAALASKQLTHARLIARAHNACSPAMLQRLMRVDAAVAQNLHATLVRQGAITAIGANGMSMATNPLNTHCITVEAAKSSNLAQTASRMKKRIQAIADRLAEDDPIVDPDHSSNSVNPA